MEEGLSKFILYTAPSGAVRVDVFLEGETVWLTQKSMGVLFDTTPQNITIHLKNIYESGEIEQEATCKEILQVQKEGEREVARNQKYYNLDAIISVGYRVNSTKATQFRIWATDILKEYMTKGFAMDDDRLKQGKTTFGKDYFRELLERVRSIRASERRVWQQITDIFAECSIDYDPKAEITHDFYAMVQNKFHYAITGKTAAEIIDSQADRDKENMGLTTWKNAPKGRILKSDVTVAKNYLEEKDIRRLERAVTGYFDYVEDLIEDENAFTMEEFSSSINAFLSFRKFDILQGKGRVSKSDADTKAKAEYDVYNKKQKIFSDFDREIKKLLDKSGDKQ